MPMYAFYAKGKKEGEAIIENIEAANKVAKPLLFYHTWRLF